VTNADDTSGQTPAPPRPGKTRPPAKRDARGRARLLVVWGSIAAVALVVLTASLVYTEQSSFCPSCHEMVPYYQAWQSGGHHGRAECVDCHVDAGVIAHLAHKPIALKEVWDHFFVDNRFPNFTVDLPNSRCIRCHPSVANKPGSLFSHALHVNRAQCKDCHAQTGHTVSLASLQAAGVLKATVTTPSIAPSGTPSSIPGHIRVVCQDCHDQAKMRCSACHQPPHEDRGECSNCHRPGPKFVASHPAGTNCAQCHTPPANHFGPDCAACHTPGVPFTQTTFTHTGNTGAHNFRSFPCVKCHPNGFTTASCTCHGGRAPTGD
jgi:nitrate/TMAO reductase-like tetraheme cytochrome c subunit